MATITAADVNKLRQMTGAGMMDCKKALMESDGDFEKAIEILRKKGQKVAANRSDREAKEGLVLAKTNNDKTKGFLVVVNCETDFVAKNDEFRSFAERVLDIAINQNISDLETLKQQAFDSELKVADKVIELIGKIGEKIDLNEVAMIEGEYVVAYNHPGNKLASMVAFNMKGEKIEEPAKQIAMQIAAMNPIAIDKDSIPSDVIEKELEIAKEQVRQEGKPEEMVEKIAQGKLNKFIKENTLLGQQFISNDKQTVEQYLKSIDPNLKVLAFKRVMLG
ncbi:MAG: elongation factor Ts [Vicingaceae bacterium]|nr:MAG: elongation factor Ts [Vicingaceae bacterium]